ncbi:hypothetical protein VTK73DRAFT_3807 [Phialemonium thermophilum]|uniref:SAC3/GANP/THP3 conserved domain-containing protein n=1 Tax=Phialemonium thermophilum TaxID=223376 RepID=A0ABR3WXG6_9PEZI
MVPSWPAGAATAGAGQPPVPYSYSTNPAFTPVQVRQGFGAAYPSSSSYPVSQPYGQPQAVPPPPPPPPAAAAVSTAYPPGTSASASPEPKKKINWPDSVRNYVQRSFLPDNLDPTVSRAEMEAKLKETISQANDSGVMYSINWDTMPLPQQMIREERAGLLSAQMSRASLDSQRDARPAAGSLSTGKKRKSSELADTDKNRGVPWRGLSDARPSQQDRLMGQTPDTQRYNVEEPAAKGLSKFQKQLEKRQKRFDGGYRSTYRSPSPPPSKGPVVGTSTALEKPYLRLTSAPVPSQVRPEHILKQSLKLIKEKWKQTNNYSYACDQLKSMRQDLTVQRIRNDFTVAVYETHARIALEVKDLGEYNQCQTQLWALYKLGLKGNPMEFKAYRILYFIHTANRTALNDALADLTTAEKAEPIIKHALDVRSALALGNYHRFFQLYLTTPKMGGYLMDMFVGRERLAALCNICKAYKPDVRLRFITEELGFESDGEAAQFIIDHNAQHLLEERADYIAFLTGKAGPFFENLRAEAFRRIDIKGQV